MGDDLTDQLNFGGFGVSEPRHNLYKTRGEGVQKKRRDDYISNLKNKRRDLTQYARALALDTPIPESIEELPLREDELSQGMEMDNNNNEEQQPSTKNEHMKNKRKSGREKYMDQLMLPEPLIDVPSDLKENWFAVPCPEGTRCLVISARNSTISRLKSGAVLNKFSSSLPSGSPRSKGKVNEYCILDCIFNEASSTYYVLDIMCWKTYSLYDCVTDFRFFWKSTKLDETTASERSESNPYIFIPLPYYSCDPQGLREALNNNNNNNNSNNNFEKKSILFYCKETDYTLGFSPLVCSLDMTSEEGKTLATRLVEGNITDSMQ